MKKLRVGIRGATGTVGQRMIQLLERHPWFEVSAVAASDNSAGKNYVQATRWMLDTSIPEPVANMTVQACKPGLDCDFVLSGLPSDVAKARTHLVWWQGYQSFALSAMREELGRVTRRSTA